VHAGGAGILLYPAAGERRRPQPSRPPPKRSASVATEAVNLASEAAEINCPTTLTRAAPEFPLK
jgi:hypothetical protein